MSRLIKATIVAASIALIVACEQEAPKPEAELNLTSDQDKMSYAIGVTFGKLVYNNLKQNDEVGIDFNQDIVLKGMMDTLEEKSKLTDQEVNELMRTLQTQLRDKKAEQSKQVAVKNEKIGTDFLAEQAKRPEVTKTESGLLYEVVSQGDGVKPSATDQVKVHYKGTLIDGTEFDSSYSRNTPAVFPLNRVIAGWTEGLQLMPAGSKFKFYIPAALAYGDRATGKIKPNSTLIFEVELLEIVSQEAQ